jgi:hypothetical protein
MVCAAVAHHRATKLQGQARCQHGAADANQRALAQLRAPGQAYLPHGLLADAS